MEIFLTGYFTATRRGLLLSRCCCSSGECVKLPSASSVLQSGAVREGKAIRPIGSLTGPEPRQNQGLSTHGEQTSRKKTHPMNAKVAGDRSQWWLIGLEHTGLLLRQVCLQEALILHCVQIMLEVFILGEENGWDTGLLRTCPVSY